MTAETFFYTIWPTVSTFLIVPLTTWLKGKMPGDWPLQASGITLVANVLSIYLLVNIMGLGYTFEQMWPFMVAGIAVSTTAHSALKTARKNIKLGDGK